MDAEIRNTTLHSGTVEIRNCQFLVPGPSRSSLTVLWSIFTACGERSFSSQRYQRSLRFSLCQLESLFLKVEGLAWLFFSSARSHFRLSVPHLWGVGAFASPKVQVSSSKLESQQTQERCCGHKTNAKIQRTFHKPQESNNSTSQ